MKSQILAMIFLLIASFIWGVAYIPTRYLGTQNVSPFLELLIRYSFPFFIFGLINIRSIIKTPKYVIKQCLLLGSILFLAITLSIYGIRSVQYGSTGLLLLSLNVIFVPLYFVLFKKAKISPLLLTACFLSFTGTVLLTSENLNTPFTLGNILCLIASIGYTIYIILCSKILKHNTSAGVLHFFQSTAFLILCIPIVFLELPSLKNIDWSNQQLHQSFLFIGFFAGTIGYQLYFFGQKKVSPVITSLILSSQAIFSALADFIIFEVKLENLQIIAYICILIAIYIASIAQKNTYKN